MQHGAAGAVDGDLRPGWNLADATPLVTVIGFAALIASWIGCLVVVATLILWG
jgi:hypothetical protein